MKRRMSWTGRSVARVVLAGLALPLFVAAQTPYQLTLAEAMEKALVGNVQTQVAQARLAQAQGTAQRRHSALQPHVSAETYANVQNRNLNAFGISAPGFPKTVGPFSNYDFRIYAQQSVFDPVSKYAFKASTQTVEAEKLASQDTQDEVARYVASVYLAAESAAARVSAARTRVNDAQTLLTLARDKHDAGTATGVDVLRAEVQLANDRQALLVAQTQYRSSLLQLARTIGLSPGTPIELAETLGYKPLPQSEAETLLDAALASRADYLALAKRRQSLTEQERANRARWYPKLSVNGNYGGIGRSIGGVEGTGLVQAQIDVTLYDRDRDGEAAELASQMRSVDSTIADLRRGVEQNVREALLNMQSAAEQVDVATQGEQLARRELELAQDRFTQGTANNVEVVTAQDELARAQENSILAVTAHMDAKFSLARALGNTRQNIEAFARGHQEEGLQK
ncbi:MAG: TolC family protein [Terracidiphilus sp.]|nr:TolC family protein [Terracidiphilus sp.]